MDLLQLQDALKKTGRYAGVLDGKWGKLTEAGILLALSDGPDTAVTDADFVASGQRLGNVQAAAIKAFWKTEANGSGSQNGTLKILPEPHRFSKNTGHRFDATNPTVSYPKWGTRPYPKTQDARLAQMLQMVRLDVDAGFASVSYGAPQIMGENFAMCGYDSPFAFAAAMAQDEQTQLRAFEAFVTAAGIVPALRRVDKTTASWEPVASKYNGTGFRVNNYHVKMRDNFVAFGGR
jgi:hypothetical protein